jgi:hypothetical protein
VIHRLPDDIATRGDTGIYVLIFIRSVYLKIYGVVIASFSIRNRTILDLNKTPNLPVDAAIVRMSYQLLIAGDG